MGAWGKGFGGVRTATGALPTTRFPGQWFQSESGLHQNWMRDYDPTTGRYIQADPLGLIDGASVYGYALGNPIRWTDPTGEFVPFVALVGGLILGRAIEVATEYVEEQYCMCGSDEEIFSDLPLSWTIYGATVGATGPFVDKPTKRIAGGGKSGSKTSVWSTFFGSTHSNPAGAARRSAGREVARKLPYVGAALGLYDAARIGHCILQSIR